MCTVSYITNNGQAFFTSNRDENKNRKKASMPKTEIRNGKKITFPQDPVGGGTWFAVCENGNIGILLNGAFQKHVPFYPYRKSRGLILLELTEATSGVTFFHSVDLENIEPFTIIFFENKKLYELRWNGYQKFFMQLDADNNYIWSSVTLYDDETINKRKIIFQNFIAHNSDIHGKSVFNFHSENNNDFENGFIINRKNGIQTQCITMAALREQNIKLLHHDLTSNNQFEQTISLKHEEFI
jgi:uncharacterized protein with NRDE domain